MLDFLLSLSIIVDAILFGKKVSEEQKHNRKWRLLGAGLLFVLGIVGLIFAVLD